VVIMIWIRFTCPLLAAPSPAVKAYRRRAAYFVEIGASAHSQSRASIGVMAHTPRATRAIALRVTQHIVIATGGRRSMESGECRGHFRHHRPQPQARQAAGGGGGGDGIGQCRTLRLGVLSEAAVRLEPGLRFDDLSTRVGGLPYPSLPTLDHSPLQLPTSHRSRGNRRHHPTRWGAPRIPSGDSSRRANSADQKPLAAGPGGRAGVRLAGRPLLSRGKDGEQPELETAGHLAHTQLQVTKTKRRGHH
jgi:hypothetical protein